MGQVQNKSNLLDRLQKMRIDALNAGCVPLATVSGVLSTKTNLVKYASCELGFDLVTTKSYQCNPNAGNREPVICQPESLSFGNSVGLRNPGIDVAVQELTMLRNAISLPSILNISLSASSAEDFITLIKKVEHLADMVELNFSCPHASAGFGSSIGCNLEIATDYVKKIVASCSNSSCLIFIKLTPNVSNIGEIAKSVIAAGADGIVAINTVGPALYIEAHSNKPILQNKIGGKGGKSGAWVFNRALECIEEIREAVGDNIPIIGMGGVSQGEHIAKMLMSGANIVGIGSAFGTVKQENWKEYLEVLRSDALQCLKGRSSNDASRFIIKEKRMEYKPHKIVNINHVSDDVIVIQLEGEMKFRAGEFVFLWLPNVGEKPFSLCLSSPITFIIKRRGIFTKELFNKEVGDVVYIRGLYGRPLVLPQTKDAILIAGGTGIALLPSLAKQLSANGTKMKIYVGSSERLPMQAEDDKVVDECSFNKDSCLSQKPTNVVEETLTRYGDFKIVYDAGKVARVLDVLDKEVPTSCKNLACYVVGPMVFMEKAANILESKGVEKHMIFLSLEKTTMCGVGLCGECSCGNRLTCQTGTFLSLEELKEMETY